MKNSLIITILVFAFLSLISSCNKLSDSNEYYVKYSVNSTTIYTGVKLNVTINDENSNIKSFVIDAKTPWEVIVGPVKTSFNSRLNVFCPTETYNKLKLYLNISISKNNGPFAMKIDDSPDTPRDSADISYFIDE